MTHERITFKRRTREIFRMMTERRDFEVQCHLCGGRMISAENFARESGISQRDVFRRIEEGNAHFVETNDHQVFVCTEP